jgi:hypothetical protein
LTRLRNRKRFRGARFLGIPITVSLILCALSALCQDPDPLFDPADTSSAIDLAEIPLGVDVLRRVGLRVQDEGLKKQFRDEFQSLQRTIEQSVSDTKIGCLLKISMYVNPDGAIAIPGGQLIAFEQTGKTPIDALANLRMTGGIVVRESLPPPFENQSYYVWIKKEKGVLKAGTIPREGREAFEREANQEFERRVGMAKVYEAMESSRINTVAKDKYWSDMAQRTLAKLRNDEERRKVKSLVQEFATAQRSFNEAYEQFLQKEEELRDQQQNLQTLQMISRIGSVVSSAIHAGELASSNNGNASVSAPPSGGQDAAKVMIEYHEKRIDSLTGNIYEWGEKMQFRGATLQQVNDELGKTFKNNGIKIPDSDLKLVLPPKP